MKVVVFVIFGVLMLTPTHAQSNKSALAYCKKTGVTGYGQSSTVERAMENAINDCVQKGGIPACCRVGARLN
ncbi:MAG: hypothetical protein JOZ16_02490 [Methylobacteriaceae bacterium]|nr:hypothetical protein [Methylobacteriaceae bacterium]